LATEPLERQVVIARAIRECRKGQTEHEQPEVLMIPWFVAKVNWPESDRNDRTGRPVPAPPA
jgi:hypothetical protein